MPSKDLPPRRRTRSDARENRDRIIEAARIMFAEEGVGVSLERVAARAEVGSATLHRHFPGRHALAAAVLDERVVLLCAAADATAPDADSALVNWLRAVIDHSAAFRGLAMLLADDEDRPVQAEEHHELIRAAGGRLLERSRQAGAARGDVTISELLKLANAIALSTQASPRRGAEADRLLGLVIDGIRPR